jgi:hypothetical protein
MDMDIDMERGMSTSNAPTFLAIAGIFKNVAPYILGWIAHHRLLDIHRFFIADNDSTDISPELFEALARLGHVELIRHTTEPGTNPQIPAYQRLVELAGDRVRWMAFIDADEFIWPTNPGPDIEDFIRTLDARGDVGALALNWATYGSGRNYFYENAPVQKRFQHCASPAHGLTHQKHRQTAGAGSLCLLHTVTHGLAAEGFSEPIEFGKNVDIPGLAHPVLRDHT